MRPRQLIGSWKITELNGENDTKFRYLTLDLMLFLPHFDKPRIAYKKEVCLRT